MSKRKMSEFDYGIMKNSISFWKPYRLGSELIPLFHFMLYSIFE